MSVTINNITYSYSDTTASVVSSTNPSSSITIPLTITANGNTYTVTSIGNDSFKNFSSLTSITLPDSITSIGNGAFNGCSSLTSITLPNSLTSIGSGVFYNCSSLISITLPNSLTSISNGLFGGCSSLISITLPDSLISIGTSAFQSCSSLTSITIPNSVISIGNNSFLSCTSLNSIFIYKGLVLYKYKGSLLSDGNRTQLIRSFVTSTTVDLTLWGTLEIAISRSVSNSSQLIDILSDYTTINIIIDRNIRLTNTTSLSSNIPKNITSNNNGSISL